MDCICGKRLAPVLKDIIPVLESHNEIRLEPKTREPLLKISLATIDRLPVSERKKMTWLAKSSTKPGALLKSQIPIKTFSLLGLLCPALAT
jgi:hypothetical protein